VVWKIANEISGRKSTSTSKIRAASQEERLKKWKDHFQNLLGKPPRVTDTAIKTIVNHELDIKRGNFTLEELQMARKKCKNKKAAPDIPPKPGLLVLLTTSYSNWEMMCTISNLFSNGRRVAYCLSPRKETSAASATTEGSH